MGMFVVLEGYSETGERDDAQFRIRGITTKVSDALWIVSELDARVVGFVRDAVQIEEVPVGLPLMHTGESDDFFAIAGAIAMYNVEGQLIRRKVGNTVEHIR